MAVNKTSPRWYKIVNFIKWIRLLHVRESSGGLLCTQSLVSLSVGGLEFLDTLSYS
jgi:hypothetical protein